MGPSYCYHSPGFNLRCDHGRLLLGNGTFQVAEDIYPSFPRLTVFHTGDIQTDGHGRGTFGAGVGLGDDSPFSLSRGNQLVLIGCNMRATLRNGNVTMSGCSSFCTDSSDEGRKYMPSRLKSSMLCSSIGCCQAPIIVNREVIAGSGKLLPITSYDVELDSFGWNRSEARELPARVFIARDGWFAPMSISHQLLSNEHLGAAPMEVPFWLDWEVTIGQQGTSLSDSWECPVDAARTVCRSNHANCTRRERGGYTCSCKDGYEGNPYISNGCQGNCITSCGNMSVPYPFGIGPPGCYLPGFNLTCDTSNHHAPRLMLSTFQVVDISLLNSTVRVVNRGVLHMYGGRYGSGGGSIEFSLWDEWPYSLSTNNELILMGCGVQAGLLGAGKPAILSGCSSFCPSNEDGTYIVDDDEDDDQYCYGMGCCQARISMSRDGWPKEFWIDWMDSNSAWDETSPHSYAFIAEDGWFRKRRVSTELPRRTPSLEIPIVLDWEVVQLQSAAGSRPPANLSSQQHYLKCPGICSSKNSFCKPRIRGYTCHCGEGYTGNPYLIDGCKGGRKYFKGMSAVIGVASGVGIVLFVLIAFLVSKKLKHHREKMMKRKFFEQNRGQLLQQLVSQKADIAERMIISLEELKKATNNFDKARELGGGGHGNGEDGSTAASARRVSGWQTTGGEGNWRVDMGERTERERGKGGAEQQQHGSRWAEEQAACGSEAAARGASAGAEIERELLSREVNASRIEASGSRIERVARCVRAWQAGEQRAAVAWWARGAGPVGQRRPSSGRWRLSYLPAETPPTPSTQIVGSTGADRERSEGEGFLGDRNFVGCVFHDWQTVMEGGLEFRLPVTMTGEEIERLDILMSEVPHACLRRCPPPPPHRQFHGLPMGRGQYRNSS
ncbi:hypothetical protein QYE76_029519 [Lolium multiflorum]|uniref:EGF-like domain-containing protein n=1 Tax=Lolium multiflorum TaxID=4521 RepID=A0AAD8QPC1_LOLMU|nr:hypothetical protein QYE76_029519 [Lolium multiflorum]